MIRSSGTLFCFLQLSYSRPDHDAEVRRIARTADSCYLFEFLRRVALLRHFVFADLVPKSEVFHEWDEILSDTELGKRFLDKPLEMEPLKQFALTNLPENPLYFMLPPYNIDINSPENLAMCLLTGNVVSMSREGKHQYIADYVAEHFGNTFALIMSLNRFDATVP